MRRSIAVLLVLLSETGCGRVSVFGSDPVRLEAVLAPAVTIVRDERGVAHVYGPTDASVAFGSAFAQAEDDYTAIELATIHAVGRAANLHGDDHIVDDLIMKAFEVERRSREEYAREPADRRVVWDAFAAGLNHYVATSGVKRQLIGRWEPWMLFARFHDIEPVPLFGLASVKDSAGVELVADKFGNYRPQVESIAWAIAPGRSETRGALLLASVFGSFEGVTRPYEIHVASDEGWSFRGLVRLGTPVPYAGFNDRIAWVITSPPPPPPLLPVTTAMTERGDSVRVNSATGVAWREYQFSRTPEGPVVARRDGRMMMMPWTPEGRMQQQYALSRARTLNEFRAVLSPGTNAMYADADGNIAQFRDGATTPDAAGNMEPASNTRERVLVNPERGWLTAGGLATSPEPDTSWTISKLAVAAFDTRMPGADSALDALVLEWEQVGGSNPQRAMKLDAALETLRGWNRVPAEGSAATTLFVRWWRRIGSGTYTGAFPRFRALEDELATFATLPIPRWSVSHYRTGAKVELRTGALPRVAGAMSRYDQLPTMIHVWPGAEGNAWILAVQPGARGAQSLIANGQSGDTGSVHFFDQAPHYVRGALLPAWYTRDDVLANARRSYRPGVRDTVR